MQLAGVGLQKFPQFEVVLLRLRYMESCFGGCVVKLNCCIINGLSLDVVQNRSSRSSI